MSVQVKGSGTIGGIDEGLVVSGIVTATSLDVSGDIDVDGHTNLDNVSISGISSTGNIYITTGGDGRKLSFAGDGSSHYFKMDHTLNGPIINGYGGIAFETNGTNERLRIDSNGRVMIGNTVAGQMFSGADDLVVGTTSGARGITIISENNTIGRLLFSDSLTSGAATYQGQVNYNHSTDTLDLRTYTGGSITLSTSNTERVTITNTGQLLLGSTSSANAGYKLESYSGGAYNIMARSTNGNGGYHNFTGQASNGTITSYITHNGRGYFEDGVQFDSSGEVLDSYEEGSFTLTPTASNGNAIALNSSYNTGVYTKVGNLVKIQAYLSFSSNSNADGYLELNSLPFTVDSNQAQASGHVRALQVVYLNRNYAYLPDGAGYYNAQLYCNEGNTWIRLYDLNDKGRRIDTIAKFLGGGADVFLNFSYLAA